MFISNSNSFFELLVVQDLFFLNGEQLGASKLIFEESWLSSLF